jgi:tetratricopeptide (TPR) repeat protein
MESRIGPAAAEELRGEHFGLLRGEIGEAGGREVKNTGDGLMAAFGSAVAAVSCAVAVQQRFERRNRSALEQLLIKVGLSSGDATVENGDYFGMPVIEASRLCERCSGGQILAKELVAHLAGGRGHSFTAVGDLELKGLPEPLGAVEVIWEPLGAEAGSLPLPARLREMPRGGLVGREAEVELLGELFAQASLGDRRLALLSGEPGIGKTRLSTHVALESRAEGAVVLYGRCDEELGVPYAPWVEALSHCVEHAPEQALRAHTERHGVALARLVPGLRVRLPDLPPATETDPDTERYLLWAAVLGLLRDASAAEPLVLVLDDLHWADKPTLLLLKHVLAHGQGLRALVLGTYRDSDLHRGHPMTEVLADFHREQGVERVAIGGLGQPEIVELMERAGGHELDPSGVALSHELYRETDGNPFYTGEILRHLFESGTIYQQENGRFTVRGELSERGTLSGLSLPQSVREVLGRRVERLGQETHSVLSVAAVIGREFDIGLLATVSERPEDELLGLLEGAVAATVLVESASAPGRFSFAHALINHTLYEDLGTTRRARLHRRIAEALEQLLGGEPGARIGELAQHWGQATTAVDLPKAVTYARLAGRRALDGLAPDEAVRWFEQALGLLDADGDEVERCEVLIGLGEARRQIGDPAFRDTLIDAARLAERLGDPVRQARAALATNRGFSSSVGRVDSEMLGVLEAAVAALPERDDPLRARVMAVLACELVTAGTYRRRRGVADEALGIARRIGDPALLADVLVQHTWATWTAGTLDERVAHLEELLELVGSLGDPVRECLAHTRHPNVVESGDVAGMWRSIERVAELAPRLGQPILQWLLVMTRSAAELFAGRIDIAEASAIEAARIAGENGINDGYAVFGGQIVCIRRDQGRLDELLELIAQSVRENPGLPGFRAIHAMALAETQHIEDARTVLTEGATEAFRDVPLDPFWSGTLTFFADVAAGLGDRATAKLLYELLLPHADKLVWNGVQLCGSIARSLGALATTLDSFDAAKAHFAAAEGEHERLEAPVWLARTWIDHARLLRVLGEDDRARELLIRADELAGRYGAAGVRRAAGATAG